MRPHSLTLLLPPLLPLLLLPLSQANAERGSEEPSPCEAAHPAAPSTWYEPSRVCRGSVHVVTEAEPRAAEIVFEEWDGLLGQVRATLLAPLAAIPPRPVFVFVYDTGNDCMEDLTSPYAAAVYEPEKTLVRAGFNRVNEGGEERYRQILRHELSHHLVHGARPDAPRWVNEGIAELFEAKPQATFQTAPEHLPLAELLAWKGPNTATVHPKYQAARTLVGGLLRSEAGPEFVNLLTSSRSWPEGLTPLMSALGAEPVDLYAAYRRQRAWRGATPLGRRKDQATALLTTSSDGLQPWMLLVAAPGFVLLVVGTRLAQS